MTEIQKLKLIVVRYQTAWVKKDVQSVTTASTCAVAQHAGASLVSIYKVIPHQNGRVMI